MRRRLLGGVAALVLAAATVTVVRADQGPAPADPRSGSAQDAALVALVEDPSGTPLSGRDPSAQAQTSLEDAATAVHPRPVPPAGAGATGTTRGAGTTRATGTTGATGGTGTARGGADDGHEDHTHHGAGHGKDPAGTSGTVRAPARPAPRPAPGNEPARVLGDPGRTGVLSNGCAAGYGRVDQCLPARAPGGARTTCAYVVTVVPKGVAVRGDDPLRLDTDGDGTACEQGDVGVL